MGCSRIDQNIELPKRFFAAFITPLFQRHVSVNFLSDVTSHSVLRALHPVPLRISTTDIFGRFQPAMLHMLISLFWPVASTSFENRVMHLLVDTLQISGPSRRLLPETEVKTVTSAIPT